MKKAILPIVIFVFTTLQGISQQLPLYSQYMTNNFLLNPAVAGTHNYTPVRLTGRMQYLGFDGAPRTYALSVHTPLMDNRMGLGGYLYKDNIGAISQTGVQLAYSYHIPLDRETFLSFGLGLRAFQYVLDETELAYHGYDPFLTGSQHAEFIPDADFGIHVYNNRLFGGLSIGQLIQYKIKLADLEGKGTNKRHYFLYGGYAFESGRAFEIMPSLLIKYVNGSPINIDLNLRGIYQKSYWAALSFRSDKSLITMVGMQYQIYVFGFAYDYSFSDIKSYSSGSVEIVLGINLGKNNKGSTLL